MTLIPPPPRRLNIDRLDLDLRGIEPGIAEAAVRALGPALTTALAGRELRLVSAAQVDAGRIASTAAPSASALAAQIAQRIADRAGGEPS
jgi:hypothetical protein